MYNVSSVRIEGKGQTVDYIEHGVLWVGRRKHTIRIRVHDDSHAPQAYGLVERWDGNKWSEVARMRGDALAVEHGIGYRTPKAEHFRADRNRLFQLAEEVL
jgi:hypothetical protein